MNARRHADGKDQAENLDPEAGHLEIERIPGLDENPLHDDDEESETDGNGRENIVKSHSQSELNAR